MDDRRRVNVETASEQLVHEVLAVIVSKILARVDDSVHVSLHQIGDDVDVLVAGRSWWLLNVN